MQTMFCDNNAIKLETLYRKITKPHHTFENLKAK